VVTGDTLKHKDSHMPQFLVAVYNQPDSRSRPIAQMEPIWEAVSALNQQATADGIFVFAGGLHDQGTSTIVDPRSGTPVISDGPYLETKEYIGGFWIIEVADLVAALTWAKLAASACQEPLEVRPFMGEPPEAGA
jgi:hypothetical protein